MESSMFKEEHDSKRYKKDFSFVENNTTWNEFDKLDIFDRTLKGINDPEKSQEDIRRFLIDEIVQNIEKSDISRENKQYDIDVIQYLKVIVYQCLGDQSQKLKKHLDSITIERVLDSDPVIESIYWSRARIELAYRIFLHKKYRHSFEEKIPTIEKIIKDLIKIVVTNKKYQLKEPNDLYPNLGESTIGYFKILYITKFFLIKQEGFANPPSTPIINIERQVEYIAELVDLPTKYDNVLIRMMCTGDFKFLVLQELIEYAIMISQLSKRIVSKRMLEVVDFNKLRLYFGEVSLPAVASTVNEIIISLFHIYYKLVPLDYVKPMKKYSNNDALSRSYLKIHLRYYSLIDYSHILESVDDYIKSAMRSTIPKHLSYFNVLQRNQKGTLCFYDYYFKINHTPSFRSHYSLLLYNARDIARLENLLLQILEDPKGNKKFIDAQMIENFDLAILNQSTNKGDNRTAALWALEAKNQLCGYDRVTEGIFLYRLAVVYYKLAQEELLIPETTANYNRCILYAEECERCLPYFGNNNLLLGTVKIMRGKLKEGLYQIEKVNEIHPFKFKPMVLLALAYAKNSEFEKAVLVAKQCCERYGKLPLSIIVLYYIKISRKLKEVIQKDFLNYDIFTNTEFSRIKLGPNPTHSKEEEDNQDLKNIKFYTINKGDKIFQNLKIDIMQSLKSFFKSRKEENQSSDSEGVYIENSNLTDSTTLLEYEIILLYLVDICLWASDLVEAERLLRFLDSKKLAFQSRKLYLQAKKEFIYKHYEKSEVLLNQALDFNNFDYDSIVLLARLFLTGKSSLKIEDAEAYLRKSRSIHERSENVYLLSLVLEKMGKQEESMELLIKSLELSQSELLIELDLIKIDFDNFN